MDVKVIIDYKVVSGPGRGCCRYCFRYANDPRSNQGSVDSSSRHYPKFSNSQQ